ncbi:MAG: glycosyltransferase [Hyphomonadaceae bacterium]
MTVSPAGSPPSANVSLVVRTMGRRLELLQGALDSINRQTRPPFEVIVVEDGSQHAKTLVERFATSGAIEFRYLTIPHSGRCVAANAGLAASQGNIVGLLDEDDELYPNHIETLSRALISASEADLVYARADIVICDGLSSGQARNPELRPAAPFEQFSRTRLWLHNQFPIQAALFRRSLFLDVGGFDPALEYLEDWDLWIRYSAHSNCLAVAEVTSLYRMAREKDEVIARASLHAPWRERVAQKHKDLVAEHRFEDVTNLPAPPLQVPTLRQAFGIGRRALMRKLGWRQASDK